MKEGLLLCDDLIFASRIQGSAKALGLPVRSARNMKELLIFLQQSAPSCVIVDLHVSGMNVNELVEAIAIFPIKPTVVGYGSHVDTATLKVARDAGFDVVWPRSKFVEELESSLPLWFQSSVDRVGTIASKPTSELPP